MKRILIISVEKDPHAISVKNVLRKRGFETVHLFVDHFPLDANISVLLQSNGEKILKIGDESEKEKKEFSFSAVYYRPYLDDIFNIHHQASIVHDFLQRESFALLKMIWESIDTQTIMWINPWGASEIAANKGRQMRLASQLDLQIPKTLITGSSDEAKSFIRGVKLSGGKTVIKTMTGMKNKERDERGGSFVTIINEEDLAETNYPLVLQEYIPKEYELRITVVGDRVFPCKITSQNSPDSATRIDWRVYDFENVKFLPAEIPLDLQQKCVQLTKALGLNYSAIDIIYEPNGGYRFLELNPNGLWLWIEELSGMPISEAIADLLTK